MPLSNLPCRLNARIVVKTRLGPALASLFALLSFASLSSGQSITSRPPDKMGPNSRVWTIKATDSPTADTESKAVPAANNPLNLFAGAVQDAAATLSEAPAVSRLEEIATGMNYWDGQ